MFLLLFKDDEDSSFGRCCGMQIWLFCKPGRHLCMCFRYKGDAGRGRKALEGTFYLLREQFSLITAAKAEVVRVLLIRRTL